MKLKAASACFFLGLGMLANIIAEKIDIEDKCHNKDEACNKFGNQGDKDIFCSIPWSVLNCPRICDNHCTFKAAILGPRVKPMNTVDECRATNLNDKNTAYKDPPDKNVICCRARTAECLACSAGTSVSEYCSNHQNVVGCDDFQDINDLVWWCKDIGECIAVESTFKDRCSYFQSRLFDDPRKFKLNNLTFSKENDSFGKRMDICGIQPEHSDSCLITKSIPQRNWGSGEYSCLDRTEEPVRNTVLIFNSVHKECTWQDEYEDDIIMNQNCFEESSAISKVSLMTEKRLKKECDQQQYWFCRNQEQCIHPNLVCDGEPHCMIVRMKVLPFAIKQYL